MPSDWNSWYSRCSRCGTKYHDSEGGCGCLEDHVECARHNSPVFVKGFGKRPGRFVSHECYVHCDDEQYEIGGKVYCVEHATCDGCGQEHDESKAPLVPFEGDVYCPTCTAEWEESPA